MAERYGASQRREIAAAVAATLRLWRQMGENFDVSYSLIERQLWAVMDTAQERITAGALEYIPAVLADTGQDRWDRPRYDIPERTLVGTAGDGLGTDSLAYGAVIHAKTAVAEGAGVGAALAQGGRFLSSAVGTLLSDTGRTAEKMAGNARPVSGYVRMLEPPSCGRCIILAGKWSKRNVAFQRHPRCDCRNIPGAENIAGEFTTDPDHYLHDLSDEGLVKALGSKANAQAYRDGADANQLINAYRSSGGVNTAQQFGRSVKYTTEGITRRGQAFYAMSRAGYAQRQTLVREKGHRYFQTRTRRLMPETIYARATSRADADRLLRLYGWIT